MSKATRDDKIAQDDPIIDDETEWTEHATDGEPPGEPAKTITRNGPKWKAIEEYWERKRLQDALQDYLTDEEE
jgi:hypothetical protein